MFCRHVRTLVLDLDDTLVHSDWTRGRGWRTFKRPGADDFIRQLAQYYELVVFTSQLPTCACAGVGSRVFLGLYQGHYWMPVAQC